MTRWLMGLAFALFLVGLVGAVGAVFAATEAAPSVAAGVQLQGSPYPSPTVTETLGPATPTAGSNQGVTATVITPTSQATRTITPTPLPATATPVRTPTLPVQFNPATATPIRVPGLPVPGPGDRLPSTGGSLMGLFNLLMLSGGLGGALFVIGRVLRRRA